MRLDKFLSYNNICSRKDSTKFCKKNEIKINDQLVKNANVSFDEKKDKVYINDELIVYIDNYYFLINKPQGYICSNKDELYPSILNLFPPELFDKLSTVGRLDFDTTGALLLTTDGKLLHQLISPKHDVKKIYLAKVNHPIDKILIDQFKAGVNLGDGEICLPAQLEIVDTNTARVIVSEGKYHQIKRMFLKYDLEVISLNREEFAGIRVDDLAIGEHRPLTQEEIERLRTL